MFIGLITGFIIFLFRISLEKLESYTSVIGDFLEPRAWIYAIFFLTLVIIGLIIGILIKYEPMIRGSGIPQIEGLLLRKLSISWWKFPYIRDSFLRNQYTSPTPLR
jgi:H+/Cl- antiporter ClcA